MKPSYANLLSLLSEPLDAWSNFRLAVTGVVVGALVFALGTALWRSSDMGGTQASRSALDDARHRLDRARTVTNELPAMRTRSGEDARRSRWTVADALHEITALAAQSGLRIGTIEPSVQKGEGLESERPLRFRAEGSFGEIRRFMEALEGLPRLVVPADVQIKRDVLVSNSLGLDATLRVFEDLPAVARPEPSRRDAFAIDPFGVKNGTGPGDAGAMLLVGTLRSRSRSMALLETAAGIDGYTPGQAVGDEWLGSVRARSIELRRVDGVARTIAFAEDRP
ncbi:type 4a pilus biogenesis protein PilO [Caballeronia sordidicola]|uniref:Type IV pilus biogenesis protein PilP n=1 Tax=Caballeronia sordidicola TaxID=196367 RepID=A0A242N8E7_CABSO|nr:type 4a pilus biogenesis protein PilO [Caballeronia sordidicola]OTP79694.1 Type IV pilus biogenesis protein PilP [Caballeronia sordidicola]